MGSTSRCEHCGADVAVGSRFCAACGHPVAATEAASVSTTPASRPAGGGWQRSESAGRSSDQTDEAAPPAATASQLAPAATRNGSDEIVEVEGQAHGVESRSEQYGESGHEVVLTFRVERYDDAGNRAFLLPVEMRGYSYEGSITEGDWVRVRGRVKRGTLHASEVENVTTGATVSASTVPRWVMIVIATIFIGFFLFLIGSCVYDEMTWDQGSGPPDDWPVPTLLLQLDG